MRSALILVTLAVPSCATQPSPVQSFGTLREALRDGKVGPRVRLSEVLAPGLCGVGAAAGLDGEITIVDGQAWVSRVRDGRVETHTSPDTDATLLFVARVPAWREVQIETDVPPEGVEAFLAQQARACGVPTDEPFAFQIAGPLYKLRMHVIAGECPVRARMLGREPTSPAFEDQFASVRGRVVGIHAKGAAGKITHHDSAVHAHVILGEDPFTGHVEAFGIGKGAVLRLPRR